MAPRANSGSSRWSKQQSVAGHGARTLGLSKVSTIEYLDISYLKYLLTPSSIYYIEFTNFAHFFQERRSRATISFTKRVGMTTKP